jgi:hypothetical protein
VGPGEPQTLGEPLKGHQDVVLSVAFSADGETLASASWDDTVILWDVASRKPLGEPLKGHQNGLWSVAFSPDGKTLASGEPGQDRDPVGRRRRFLAAQSMRHSQPEFDAQGVGAVRGGRYVPYQAPCPELPVPKD